MPAPKNCCNELHWSAETTNNKMTVLEHIYKGIGQIALLIDPEKAVNEKNLTELVRKAEFAGVHFLFVG